MGRSLVMSRIRSRDTKPEMAVRRMLHAMGYRFRLHCAGLPGRPDIVLPRHRAVVFVHGCFWHSCTCQRGRTPRTNTPFWAAKLARNRARDKGAAAALHRLGWRIIVVWECELCNPGPVRARLLSLLPR